METEFSEQIAMLKSMGFSHLPESIVAGVLRQNGGDLERALDQLLAMQFDTSEQEASPSPATRCEDNEITHNVPQRDSMSGLAPEHLEASHHSPSDAQQEQRELVDTLVGLLLDLPERENTIVGDHASDVADSGNASSGQFGLSPGIDCADLERVLLGLPPTDSVPAQDAHKPHSPATTLAPTAAVFYPAQADGFQEVRRQRQPPQSQGAATGAGFSELVHPERVRLVVFVGLPGSGKSTLAQQFRRHKWWVVSQDDLGNRRACEDMVYKKLLHGQRVVVDRTNMDRQQREHWTRIARDLRLPIQAVVAVHLDVPMNLCKQRVMSRRDHKTLPATPQSLGIIERFGSTFEAPHIDEGFCAVLRSTGQRVHPSVEALAMSHPGLD